MDCLVNLFGSLYVCDNDDGHLNNYLGEFGALRLLSLPSYIYNSNTETHLE